MAMSDVTRGLSEIDCNEAIKSYNEATLARLNRLSLSRSFTPQIDIDWDAETTEEEFAALYKGASLLVGSGRDGHLDRAARARFARYQQMNLMLFTALLERHGIGVLAQMYDQNDSQPFTEYLGNFLKEEIYHYTMFTRAIEKLQKSMPGSPPLPTAALDRAMRWLFACIGMLPSPKLRANLAFTFFAFAEQLTIFIHQLVQEQIERRESFVNQIWAYHALEEARHLVFDRMMLEQNRLPPIFSWAPRVMGGGLCVLLAVLVNRNELWIARQVGVPVRLWHLPRLIRVTQAPFKRHVFGLISRVLRGHWEVAAEATGS
jgi:hypothetical protein